MITELLKMIEEVDPLDTMKLDEIDAMVWCWLNPLGKVKDGKWCLSIPNIDNEFVKMNNCLWCGIIPEYTRSRDALKAIRPDGWEFKFDSDCGNNICAMWRGIDDGVKIKEILSKFLPTEELAEIHAILQAINYERRAVMKGQCPICHGATPDCYTDVDVRMCICKK